MSIRDKRGNRTGSKGRNTSSRSSSSQSKSTTSKSRDNRSPESSKENKKKAVKRVRKRRVHIGGLIKRLAVLLIICLALYSVAQTTIFNVDKISVKGAEVINPDEIIKVSGVYVGQNIFGINKDQVVDNIKTNTMIKDAQVKKIFPNKVQLVLTERHGASVIASNKGFYIVDSEGYLIKKDDAVNTNYPLVTGLTMPKEVVVGAKVEAARLNDALVLANKINGRYGTVVNEIKCEKLGELAFFLGNIEIRVGGKNELDEKLAVLDDVLANISLAQKEKIDYIDVSAPSKPAVKMK